MITESEALEIYESYKRCRVQNPGNIYWDGAVAAMKEVLRMITDEE